MKKLFCSFLATLMTTSLIAQPLVVILMGTPGSGKTTQASKLSDTLQMPHFTISDLYSKALLGQSHLCDQLQKEAKEGRSASDEELIELVVERIKQSDCQKGFILNNFPKTLHQAALLRDQLENQAELAVFHFEIDDTAAMDRLSHIPDSDLEICKERIKAYHDKTEPLHYFYKKSCSLTSLDARLNPDQVTTQILQTLQKQHQGHATASCPAAPTHITH